jgi:hypothetical protein
MKVMLSRMFLLFSMKRNLRAFWQVRTERRSLFLISIVIVISLIYFSSFVSDTDSETSGNLVTNVLFGMIVREKRRIAALARTVSSLDERLQVAEKVAINSASALRTYLEEQSEEVAALSLDHQEHILSLMDLVKEESGLSASTEIYESNLDSRGERSDAAAESTILVLANERIEVLEQSLEDLKSQKESYQFEAEQLGRSLQLKSDECEYLLENLNELHRGIL